MSGFERTGWRDQGLSERHRLWGMDCPMTDIDYLVTAEGAIGVDDDWLSVEYDALLPRLLVDYKHWKMAWPPTIGANLVSFGCLGDMAGLPACIVRYGGEEMEWENWWIAPINNAATAKLFAAKKQIFSIQKPLQLENEAKFVHFLYWIRGTGRAPQEVIDRINATKTGGIAA